MIKNISNTFNHIFKLYDPKKRDKIGSNIKIVFKAFNFIIFLLTFCIFKILKLKLFSSSIEALGHQIIDLESFRIDKIDYPYKLVISIDNKHIANRHFFLKYQKKNINCLVVKNKFISTILHYQKRFSSITFDSFDYTANEKAKSYYLLKNKFKESNFYRLSSDDYQFGMKFLIKRNLDDKKIILLHTRDSNYRPFDKEKLRNSDIESLRDSVEWLTNNNFKIIRIGHHGSLKASYDNKILDLTELNNPKEKEILSIFLSNICELFIGSSSGAKSFAAIFGKPILTVNAAPLPHVLEACSRGISLPKLYKENGNFIKFKHITELCNSLKEKEHEYRRDYFYEKRNIEIIDNSSEEILNATKEIINLIKNNNFKEDENQKKFREIMKQSYSGQALGSVSSSFLNKYERLLY